MRRRRAGHDYHSRRIYLVTLTVEARRPLLGQLVGNAEAPDDSAEAPRVELSELGKRVEACWKYISREHPEMEVLATMIMPDHLHGILFVERQMEQHLGNTVAAKGTRGTGKGTTKRKASFPADISLPAATTTISLRERGNSNAGLPICVTTLVVWPSSGLIRTSSVCASALPSAPRLTPP